MTYCNIDGFLPIGSYTVPPTGNNEQTQKNDVNAKITEYFQSMDTIPPVKTDTLSDKERMELAYNENVKQEKKQSESDLKTVKEAIKSATEKFKEKYPDQTEAVKRFERYSQMNSDDLFNAYKIAIENGYSPEEKNIIHLELSKVLLQ